ncbi:hypothetical protein C2G38_2188237 [Gigaspora rosea]|uniref:Uncharacterized protein n=1 Tax=Gigaspora rosea TaxID=44941 RepID=A0A397V3P1_9GLOM|nr:hypothetical protein C2G38_2188237 [Gigaspora rosea]
MQPFLKTPTFDKKYIFKNSSNLYKNFCNAYAYYIAISMRNLAPKKQDIFTNAQEEYINSLSSMLHSVISSEISSSTIETETPYYNATAQKNSLAKQKDAEK